MLKLTVEALHLYVAFDRLFKSIIGHVLSDMLDIYDDKVTVKVGVVYKQNSNIEKSYRME